jgi:hypothetical protein
MRVLIASLALVAWASSPGGESRPDRVSNGEWGGKGVRLSVEDAGAAIEFDCAHGKLREPLALDANGRFDVEGILVEEGGPDRIEDAGDARPARYRGDVEGERMRLEVILEGGRSFGSFRLLKGAGVKLVKCL